MINKKFKSGDLIKCDRIKETYGIIMSIIGKGFYKIFWSDTNRIEINSSKGIHSCYVKINI